MNFNSVIMYAVCVFGLGILAMWLLKTSLGRKSLVEIPPTTGTVTVFFAFGAFIVWLMAATLPQSAVYLADKITSLANWQETLAMYILLGVLQIIFVVTVIILSRQHIFAGIQGFGVNFRRAGRDAGAAILNLLAAAPIIYAAVIVTQNINTVFHGKELETSPAIEELIKNPQLAVKMAICAVAICTTPICEEFVFRGLLQSAIRGATARPWTSIVTVSVLFSVLHPQTHWPAIFALSVCLGYAYEKSGSLLRPILMHTLFNGINIMAALYQ